MRQVVVLQPLFLIPEAQDHLQEQLEVLQVLALQVPLGLSEAQQSQHQEVLALSAAVLAVLQSAEQDFCYQEVRV